MNLDVICIGTALIDSIIRGFDPVPVSASGFRADSCSLNVGGEAVNESVALAKLGMSPHIMCFLGEDGAGRLVEENLVRNGVDTSMVMWEKDQATPITTMFVNPDGSRKSITNKAHSYNFHPEQCCHCFKGAEALILGSLFRAPFDDIQVIGRVISEAKEQGLLIIADTKLPNFQFLGLKDLSDYLPMVDYITPNEDEAKYYSGRQEPEAMAGVFLSYGIRNVAIKLGDRGCYFKNKDFSLYLTPYNIQALDATGAGDNFVAGLASELLRGSNIRDSLDFANACGAICTTEVGAGTALKSRDQVIEFMESHRLKE